MAKNLQSVLNSVVNELLQEVGNPAEDLHSAQAMRAMDPSASRWLAVVTNPDGTLNVDKWNEFKDVIGDADKQQLFKSTRADGNPLFGRSAYRDAISAEELGRIEAQNTVSPSDQAYSAYLAAKGDLGYGVDQARKWMGENPLATAGIGTGIGAALAAGAGALYLRKKQREANRAAGR